jgi:Uma2 family endonuclease
VLDSSEMLQPVDKPRRVTPAEYLALEKASPEKHEYLRGQIFAMAGASPKHNLVCGNIIGALRDRLRARRCAVMPDQHVYIEATELGTYPDVTVLCAPAKFHPDFPHSLVNPSILIEVLSPSTEAYDRGAKFDHYSHLQTLQGYVLVATDRFAVDHYLREADGSWRLTTARGLDAGIRFPSVDVVVPLREIYENLDLVAPDGIEEVSPHPPGVTVQRT